MLRKCLVDPRKVNLSFEHSDNSLEVWLVLEEKPTEIEGYIVFFDERESCFGLAYRSNPHSMVSVGHYGGFLEAFDGM